MAAILVAATATGAPATGVAQDLPARPPGMTDAQIQQQLQSRGLGDQIRQRIQQSGLTPDQIRARLRAAGYSESLVDAYLQPSAAGQAAPAPTLDVLRAASALGFADFVLADTGLARRDSIFLTRADSFLLDTLNLEIGRDSIPTQRDSLGILRLDTTAIARAADRTRRPRLFGLDIFRRTTNQFAVVSNGPVDADYRLGPGDELVLILTGDIELAHELTVTREGFVVVPQVGQLPVANITLAELRALLFSRLSRVYAGLRRGNTGPTRFDVTVTRVRVNQVFVTGEVVRPGAYPVSAIGTVMNALYQAGGPTERGNFRAVRVVRHGQTVRTFDVYAYILNGVTSDDIRLEQGDVIFVPIRGRRATVTGSVHRPAIYELADGQELRELLAMAGGLTSDAYTGRLQIERVLPAGARLPAGGNRTVLDIDLREALEPDAAPVRIESDDRVRAFPVSGPVRNRITIRGNVWRPGDYRVEPGMRLSAALAIAGGLKTDTYLERAHVRRLMPDSTRRLLAVDLRLLPLRGDRVEGVADPAADPELNEFDEITVYSRTGFRPERQVRVYGSVQRPGAYTFVDSMSLRDAIMLAGGLRDEAYLLQAEIARLSDDRSGEALAELLTVPLDSSYVLDPTGYLRRRTNPSGAEPRLEPFDNIFIRRLPGWELQRNVVITGDVRFPGRYTLSRRDERVLDVINRAGGLLATANAQGFQIHRVEGRAGRIGINLTRVMREPSFRDNLVLLAGDSMHVPQYQSVVIVEGAVNSPVAVAYEPGRNARYYVDRAGGFARRADKKRTYVVQPNGSVERGNVRAEPGARVVVPEIPADEGRTNWATVWAAVTTILTSAVTLIVVLKR